MLLNETYFESFTQKNIEEFLCNYRNTLYLLNKNGSSAFAYYHLGELSEKFQLFYQAINNYKCAINEDPSYENAYLALIKLYLKHGLYYSAKKLIRESAELSPGNNDILDTLRVIEERFPHRTVTFYIPCYNVERHISQAIEGALSQSYEIDEIIVIDDGSKDGSIEIAGEYPVKIIRHEENKGLAAVRNTALRNAKGEFIATVDTDASPDMFWLERLILSFNNSKIAGVCGRLIEGNTVTAIDKWRQVRMRQHHGDSTMENVFLFGCNTVFRADILRSIGGYNEVFRTNFEDMDISKRLLSNGYETRYIPDALCRHQRTDTLITAVDTCYNWRKPHFEINGAFRNIEWLTKKGINDINTIITDIECLIQKRQYDVIYPDFLMCIRTIFKDMLYFYKNLPTFENFNTLKAGLVVLLFILRKSQISERLSEYILEDINDIISVLEMESGYLTKFKQKAREVIETKDDMHEILKILHISSFANLKYISQVFSSLSNLFNIDSHIASMVETSARRIRYEAEQSIYSQQPKVMLLNPPWKVKNRKGVRAGSRWPFTSEACDRDDILEYAPFPFFLSYLSSILKSRGINNVIVDAIAEGLSNNEFIERIAGFKPDIVVIEVSTASFLVDTLWLFIIKKYLPDVRVIWAGTHVTATGEKIIQDNPFVDFIIQGEYEKAAANLIEALVKGKEYSNIKGLLFIDESGRVINNGRADTMEDINELPLPERLTLPIYKYNDLFAGMQYPSLQIHASRGCPFSCIYCAWPQVLYGNRKYRARSPEKVAQEIEMCVKEFGFKSFYFDDDTFNIGKGRILSLCEELKKRGITIPWGAMARADTADYETLNAMKDAGLVGIKFGVESGNQGLIDGSGKSLDLKRVEEAVKWCKELQIKVHLTFTFGLPGETGETVRETIEFAKQMNPDTIQFSITTPFPGTRYFEILKNNGNLLTEEWEKYDGAQYTVIKSESLSKDDLEESVRQASHEFYQFKSVSKCN